MASFIEKERGNFFALNKLDPFMDGHKGFICGGCFKNLFNGDSAVAEANRIRREDPAAMDLEAEVNQLYNDIVNLQEDYQSTVVMPYA